MSLIVAMIFPICSDASLISLIDCTISCILPLPVAISVPSSSTLLLIFLADSAFCETSSDTSVIVAASSCVILACSVAPSARFVELSDTCSEPLATSSATLWIPLTVVAILSSNIINESKIPLKSPFHSTSGCTSKLPFENSPIALEISSTYEPRIRMDLRILCAKRPTSSSE